MDHLLCSKCASGGKIDSARLSTACLAPCPSIYKLHMTPCRKFRFVFSFWAVSAPYLIWRTDTTLHAARSICISSLQH